MALNIQISDAAVRRVIDHEMAKDYIADLGEQVRDRARVNARGISDKTDAIVSVPGEDADGVYARIGYDKHHPGFVLWWHEVGTVNHPPRPHLRPALQQVTHR